jgi:hypothetical protein
MNFFIVVCLAWTMFACSPNSPTQNPAVNVPAQDPGAAPLDSNLSESEILQIVRSSLAVYPWRLDQNVLVKETGQTLTSLTEVQSSTRGYTRSVQTLGVETVTIESILMDELVYLKMSGSPAETYGLPDGLWLELPPDSPLAQLVDRSALEPAGIVETFVADFAAVSGESGVEEMLFTLVGSETVNGIPTNIYEAKGATFTYRWWIGADQRFYKTTLDKPEATRTILVEYDPGINIQAPIP